MQLRKFVLLLTTKQSVLVIAQALLQRKRKILGTHGDEDLVLTPDINRHIDGSHSILGNTRTFCCWVAEGLYQQRDTLILKRTDRFRG